MKRAINLPTAKRLQYVDKTINIEYRRVSFKLDDFLAFQSISSNPYQYDKARGFLKKIQRGVLVEHFDNKHYQSLVAVPVVSYKRIKKYFIQLVHLFKEHDLIEDNYKIISNGHYYFTKEFNNHDISEGFVIYEKLSI